MRFSLLTCGVIRVELKSLHRAAKGTRLVTCLEALGDAVIGALVTIEPQRTRMRRLNVQSAQAL